ncbi:diaminopimelate decarboxylase, partial [Streptococcus pyogenes]
GGIGVNYKPEQEQNDIVRIGAGVHAKYDEILVPNGLGNLKIYTELGRFMLAPHGHLVTKVLHIKDTYRRYVGVDATAANLMRP